MEGNLKSYLCGMTAALLLFAAVARAANAPLRVAEAEAKKAALEKPAPDYPAVARQLKIGGSVEIEAMINPAGAVTEVRAVRGNAVLTKPAMDAVKKWKFRPFQEQDKPVEAVVILTFEFGTR
jgi:periplasmic protein TonB